jgi:hypothetical protein
VTPETREHLDKAREYLGKARGLLDVMHYNDEAKPRGLSRCIPCGASFDFRAHREDREDPRGREQSV